MASIAQLAGAERRAGATASPTTAIAVTRLLAILERLQHDMPPALAVRPDDALAAARGSMLVGASLPPVYAQAAALARRIEALSDTRAALVDAQAGGRRQRRGSGQGARRSGQPCRPRKTRKRRRRRALRRPESPAGPGRAPGGRFQPLWSAGWRAAQAGARRRRGQHRHGHGGKFGFRWAALQQRFIAASRWPEPWSRRRGRRKATKTPALPMQPCPAPR